ncbi:monovalent cation/H(+) antiporter subunit G [Cystobacter fuscus]|nr:monovalent cation/H(+) antiporter subunit G [Cystobacter fuscus]
MAPSPSLARSPRRTPPWRTRCSSPRERRSPRPARPRPPAASPRPLDASRGRAWERCQTICSRLEPATARALQEVGVKGLATRVLSQNGTGRGRVTDRSSSLSEDLELAHGVRPGLADRTLLVAVFLMLTAPMSAHAIARAATREQGEPVAEEVDAGE